MDRIAEITRLLQEALTVQRLDIEDESALHAGHAGAASGGGHFQLYIWAQEFEGMGTLAIHRKVYEILGDMMKAQIHALGIHVMRPQ